MLGLLSEDWAPTGTNPTRVHLFMAHVLDVRILVRGQVIHKERRKELDGQHVMMMLVHTEELLISFTLLCREHAMPCCHAPHTFEVEAGRKTRVDALAIC